jgi:hypothetical protein
MRASYFSKDVQEFLKLLAASTLSKQPLRREVNAP